MARGAELETGKDKHADTCSEKNPALLSEVFNLRTHSHANFIQGVFSSTPETSFKIIQGFAKLFFCVNTDGISRKKNVAEQF